MDASIHVGSSGTFGPFAFQVLPAGLRSIHCRAPEHLAIVRPVRLVRSCPGVSILVCPGGGMILTIILSGAISCALWVAVRAFFVFVLVIPKRPGFRR